MTGIHNLSILREFKYLHLSDKISKGEVNLDGNWIKYNGNTNREIVNFDDYTLLSGTIIYGDDNIIYLNNGTIFISERSKEKLNNDGDIVGYLFKIESRWQIIKYEGDKKLPYYSWCKELNHFILFIMFCVLTIVGGSNNLLLGLLFSVVIGGSIWGIGDIILYYRNKDFVREYIRANEYDDYSKILIQEYLSNDNYSLMEKIRLIFHIRI